MPNLSNIYSVRALPDPQLSFKWDCVFPTLAGYTPVVERVGIPSTGLERQVSVLGGKEQYYPGFERVGTLPVTFYQDSNGDILGYIAAWRNLIRNPDGTRNYPATYEKTVVVNFYPTGSPLGIALNASAVGGSLLGIPAVNALVGAVSAATGLQITDPIVTVTLNGVFPLITESVDLNYDRGGSGRLTYRQEFNVSSIDYKVGSNIINRALNSPLASILNTLGGSILSRAFSNF